MGSKSAPKEGFSVGPVQVDVPVLLAPMEDVTNLAFRLIAKRIANPGLMFTEFVSAMAIHHGAEKTLKKMRILDSERPLGIQIFGGEPEVMAETARLAEEMGADILDVNMGCWVPKVCKTGSGAALLKDPETAEKIIDAVVKAVNIPVTVKVRAGWDYSLFAAPDLVRRFQDVGAQMISLHARFAKQGFEGEANWQLIADLREAVQVPLIGNGDVKSAEDAKEMMSVSGCDGVMVGRAAISNPWKLAEICAGIAGKEAPEPPTLRERIEVAVEHAQTMTAFEAGFDSFDEVKALPAKERETVELKGIRALRGQLPLYIKGYFGAAQVRGKLSRVCSIEELVEILEGFEQSLANDPGEPQPQDVKSGC